MFLTSFERWAYANIAKPFFFRQDPEVVHDRMIEFGKRLGRYSFTQSLTKGLFSYQNPTLSQTILGIQFENPVGLAAGFDKNAELTNILPSVGFGFEEVGSITGEVCEGNPKPRLWRLPKSKGLVVHYGLKNDGCEAIATRLHEKTFSFPIGTSIAKTNSATTVELQAGINDYVKAFKAFTSIGSYFTINISCPNAFGGEPFADPIKLEALLAAIDPIPTTKPIFVKLTADISIPELDALVQVMNRHRVHGIILSNLTKRRDSDSIDQDELAQTGKGGISGKPVYDLSNNLISHLYRTTNKKYILIGVGGIFSAEDAYEKITRGASLVQLATGMIFQGPQLIGDINHGLVKLLQKDGFTNISEAVGTAA
ncbi:MAG: quinone-dependent dihydroorotate dehydrogenase [Candidatus Uhrbacteria bacterium]